MNKYKNNKNRKDNFITTFKVDADVEKYFKNISMINFLERVKNRLDLEKITQQDYLNNLIRRDMLSFYKIKNISSIDEYFEKNNIKEK